MLIETGLVVDGLARVLGVAGQRQGLGLAEGGRSPDLDLLVGVNLEDGRFSRWFPERSLRALRAQDVEDLLTPFRAALAAPLAEVLPLEVPVFRMTHQQSLFPG